MRSGAVAGRVAGMNDPRPAGAGPGSGERPGGAVSASLAAPRVEAPRTGADRGDVQEDEAVERRELPAGGEGPRAPRKVELPVDHRQLPGGEEGGGAGEEPEEDERA